MSAHLLVNHTDSHCEQIVLNLSCFTTISQQEKVNSKQSFWGAGGGGGEEEWKGNCASSRFTLVLRSCVGVVQLPLLRCHKAEARLWYPGTGVILQSSEKYNYKH